MKSRDRDKTQIWIGGQPVGMPLSETHGALIVRWLDSDGVMEALTALRVEDGERVTVKTRECEHYCAGQVIGNSPDASCMCGAIKWAD